MVTALLIASLALTADASLYAPTPVEAVEKMLQVAEVTRGDVVYDLGCGDGRVLILASALYGCRSVGIEIDPECVETARRNVMANAVGNLVSIREGDVLEADFREATVVALYLMPDLLEDLAPRLNRLAAGTRVVCYDKSIPGFQPSREVKLSEHLIYLYMIPLVPVKCATCTGST